MNSPYIVEIFQKAQELCRSVRLKAYKDLIVAK